MICIDFTAKYKTNGQYMTVTPFKHTTAFHGNSQETIAPGSGLMY